MATPPGRTYRYFTQTPLYAFGYGLSFTKFVYSNLQLVPTQITLKSTVLTACVTVSNNGAVAGEEVTQVILRGDPFATDLIPPNPGSPNSEFGEFEPPPPQPPKPNYKAYIRPI